jgi:Uma2 family endonuclease
MTAQLLAPQPAAQEATENTQHTPITGEELAALGDIGPCELVKGEIVRMSPTGRKHGRIEMTIGRILGNFVVVHNLGEVLGGETGVYTHRDPDSVRAVDVAFIAHARAAQMQSASFLDVAPEFVVEVLSPDDRWLQVDAKLNEYFAIGVLIVWIVNPEGHEVSVYRSVTEVQRFGVGDELTCEPALPDFRVPVAELFGISSAEQFA